MANANVDDLGLALRGQCDHRTATQPHVELQDEFLGYILGNGNSWLKPNR
jgi:hypothetical protein